MQVFRVVLSVTVNSLEDKVEESEVKKSLQSLLDENDFGQIKVCDIEEYN